MISHDKTIDRGRCIVWSKAPEKDVGGEFRTVGLRNQVTGSLLFSGTTLDPGYGQNSSTQSCWTVPSVSNNALILISVALCVARSQNGKQGSYLGKSNLCSGTRPNLLRTRVSLGNGLQNLAVTPRSELLLCVNISGNYVVAFRIDQQTGNFPNAGNRFRFVACPAP